MPQHLWTDPYLDSMRHVGDPPADTVVAELFAGGATVVQAVNYLMRDLVENDDLPSRALPQHVRDYFQAGLLPAWADPARLAAGAELFQRFGPLAILLLNAYSLPLCYAARRGVQVLARSDRLHSNPRRRIVETAQMVIDVMSPGGLDPDSRGAGLRSAQKVRLMHATIRHLLGKDPSWDPALGLPINQEDLAGTLGAFAIAVLDGLARLDVDLRRDEIDAYVHTWNVVGHVMGVRDELLPANFSEGRALADRIAERNFEACPEGQMMTHALLGMMAEMVPGSALDGVPAQFVRHFVGDPVADMLGVPAHDAGPLVRAWRVIGRISDEATDRSLVLRQLARRFSGLLIDGLLLANRGGSRVPFTIPTELRQVWGVNWH
ncbi:MAG: DUF2236 domain-containing protein [Myxococcales bacterium]|nr:DUF2236 domain-containing protein [Myxococcales bacterium]